MRFFEFLCPDKSPQNARMPKRLNTLKRKKRQTTHTPHPHHKKHPEVSTNTPRSFANTTIAHSKFLMCIDAKFPPIQQSTPKFRNTLNSKVSDYLKRPSKFPYTHEVREFLTIPHPNTSDQTPTPHPRSILGFLIASKIPTFQGKISHLGVSTDHHPRHRERAVIRLCACRKMPNTLADVNLP